MEERSPVDWKRMALFFLGSIVIFLTWQVLFPPARSPGESAAPPSDAAMLPVVPPSPAPSAIEPPAIPAGDAVEEGSVRRVTVSTPRARIELTNVGGRVTAWKLLEHGEYGAADQPLDMVKHPRPAPPGGDSPPPELGAPPVIEDRASFLPLQVSTGDAALDRRLSEAMHVVEVQEVDGTPTVTLRWSDGAGTAVIKRLEFRTDWPIVTIEAHLIVGGRPVPFSLGWGPGIANHTSRERANTYFREAAIAYRSEGELVNVKPGAEAADLPRTAVDWAALEDSFFAVMFVPTALAGPPASSARVGYSVSTTTPPPSDRKGRKRHWSDAVVLSAPFHPDAPIQSLYVGPRNRELLKLMDAALPGDHRVSQLMDVGIVEPIVAVMHRLLVWFHAKTASWGAAILLLTLAIRAVMFPLNQYSLKKMRVMQDRMKVVKPKQESLKEKYRKLPRSLENRQREQQELMTLYQGAGINPADQLLGCLPLLLSLPFFFALFRLLQQESEFRHQPFLIWPDLSSADLTHVWPILTGLTMFVSSKLSISSASGMDPMQKNMLYVFPVMFTWICWGAPLGLVVYWTTSNVIQIGQQYLLKFTLPPAESGKAETPKPSPKSARRLVEAGVDATSVAATSSETWPQRGKKRRKR